MKPSSKVCVISTARRGQISPRPWSCSSWKARQRRWRICSRVRQGAMRACFAAPATSCGHLPLRSARWLCRRDAKTWRRWLDRDRCPMPPRGSGRSSDCMAKRKALCELGARVEGSLIRPPHPCPVNPTILRRREPSRRVNVSWRTPVRLKRAPHFCFRALQGCRISFRRVRSRSDRK